MALAKNIRYLRKKQGWSQDILADKLGYKSYTTIQKWESGVSEPPLKIVHVLADLFNIDINDLTGADLEASSGLLSGSPSELDILDEIDVAFYGDYKVLNEEHKETLRAMARLFRERQDKQE